MLGLLPSDQFSVTVRVSKRLLDRLLMSSIITRYTLWNAEYRISLMRNFDISTSNWKRSGFPGESEISEVKREESEGGAGQVDVDCCVEDLESVNLPSLGDLSPKALNYIQQLESELSSAKKVPWIQVSRSSSLLLMVKPAVFLVAVGMGALLHLSLLAFNALAIQGLSTVSGGSKSMFAKRENVVALLLVASQKTLPVMVAVVEQLGGALGESGLLVLPCVAAHLNQSDADKLHRRLVRLKSTNRTRERLRRDGFLGLFVHKVDLLDYHEKKLQDLEVNKPY